MNPKSSTLDKGDNDDAPMHSPTTSRRRPRRPTSGTGSHLRYTDSRQKRSHASVVRLLLSTIDLCSKNTAKCALLTCASGMAWASLIVWILGPAVSTPGVIHPVGDDHQQQTVPGSGEGSAFPIGDHNSDGFWLPGWTPLGHHSRFLGREAFPEQFEHWGEAGEVVINGVDVAPLAVGDEVLPRADLVLAILSGDDEEAKTKRDTLRDLYDKYEGRISVGGKQSKGENKEPSDMSFRVVFVVTRSTASSNGDLVGDVLYVNAPDGYRNIVYKVKHMMGLVRWRCQ
ncbi:unnamed protein product [Hapterophycus canaliculatus]